MIRLLALLAALTITTSGCTTPQEWIGFFFRDDAPEATRIAECESGLRWDAVSPGGGNHGAMQLNVVHRREFERVTGQRWEDAVYGPHNIMFAKWLFDQQGFEPWTCH